MQPRWSHYPKNINSHARVIVGGIVGDYSDRYGDSDSRCRHSTSASARYLSGACRHMRALGREFHKHHTHAFPGKRVCYSAQPIPSDPRYSHARFSRFPEEFLHVSSLPLREALVSSNIASRPTVCTTPHVLVICRCAPEVYSF